MEYFAGFVIYGKKKLDNFITIFQKSLGYYNNGIWN